MRTFRRVSNCEASPRRDEACRSSAERGATVDAEPRDIAARVRHMRWLEPAIRDTPRELVGEIQEAYVKRSAIVLLAGALALGLLGNRPAAQSAASVVDAHIAASKAAAGQD